jgi:hypothetical protein
MPKKINSLILIRRSLNRNDFIEIIYFYDCWLELLTHFTQNLMPSINPAIYGGVGTRTENPGFSHYLCH